MPPPVYDEKSAASSSRARGSVNRLAEDDELPAYAAPAPIPTRSSSRARVEHAFYIRGGGKPWLKLVVRSRAAKPEQMPYLLGGEPVTGYVELTLEKPEYFLAVEVSMIGETRADVTPVTFEKRDPWTFLSLSKTLWRATEPAKRASFMDMLRPRTGEKLTGTHRFEFSLDLPKSVSYASSFADEQHEFPLPASFTEQGAMCGVTYEIAVKVKKSSLGSHVGLETDVAYCPAIRPPPFSALRRAASEEGEVHLLGPEHDPAGWTAVGSTTLCGNIFGDREVQVACTLWLATPLSYTRGTFVPCVLIFSSTDSQALDLLSSPSAPDVKLLGNLAYRPAKRQNWKREDHARLKGKAPAHVVSDKNIVRSRIMQSATWWTPTRERGEQREEGKRVLFGEIHLSPKLKPAFVVPDFKLFYTVALFPFHAPGFVPTASTPLVEAPQHCDELPPLMSAEIEIATLHAKGRGCIPQAVTPPAYEQPGKWPNLILGMFESW